MRSYVKNSPFKKIVIDMVTNGKPWSEIAVSTYKCVSTIIHARFKSPSGSYQRLYKYSFDVHETTLAADYEVWICGTSSSYYCMPMSLIKDMYIDPDAYINQRLGCRVISIDILNHLATYAKNSKAVNLSQYRNIKLEL